MTTKLKRKKLRVLTFYKPNWPVPYIVLSFQLPTKVVYPQPEDAKVLCRPPVIGQYLQSDINGQMLPYIDFLPLGRTTPGTHCYTRMARVRLNIGHLLADKPEGTDEEQLYDLALEDNRKSSDDNLSKVVVDWNLDSQRVVLMERGIVFGIIEVCLKKEFLWMESDMTHPVILKGAFEST